MKLICKLFGFILDLFTAAVDGIGYALGTVGTVLITTAAGVLGAGGEAIGNILGIDGTLLTWALLGLGAYFLLNRKNEQEIKIRDVRSDNAINTSTNNSAFTQ